MRFEVSPNLISAFYHEGETEVEGLFNEKQMEKLLALLEKSGPINQRRDHFAKDPSWKKLLFGSGPSHIASALSRSPALQIGFDQVFLAGELPEHFALAVGEHLEDGAKAIGSLSHMACGMMLSKEKCLFFHPNAILEAPEEPVLICCWIVPGCRFAENRDDPLYAWLKQSGYSAGDVITPNTHPIVKK